MVSKSSNQKTLRAVMQEERSTASTLAARLLSTDSSRSNPSFRTYYGVASAGAVPFLWESAPGTPKNASSAAALPPLTPPPSYYSKAASKSSKKLLSSSSSSSTTSSNKPPASFLRSIFRRSHTMPSPATSASQDSLQVSRRKRLVASPRSSFSSTSRGEDEDVEGAGQDAGPASPTSTLCFRARAPSAAGRKGGAAAAT